MKLLLEILISIILHPIAVILTWVDLYKRTDMPEVQKIIWALVCLFWGLGPILYILVGGGELWR
jgi:hypothetical protein